MSASSYSGNRSSDATIRSTAGLLKRVIGSGECLCQLELSGIVPKDARNFVMLPHGRVQRRYMTSAELNETSARFPKQGSNPLAGRGLMHLFALPVLVGHP